jgi:hypothetical protein
MNTNTVEKLYKAYENIAKNVTDYEIGNRKSTTNHSANAATQGYEQVKRIHQLEKSYTQINYLQSQIYSSLFDIHNSIIGLTHAIKTTEYKTKEFVWPKENPTTFVYTYDPSYLFATPESTHDKRPKLVGNKYRDRKPCVIPPKQADTRRKNNLPLYPIDITAKHISVSGELPSYINGSYSDQFGNTILQFHGSFGTIPLAQAVCFRARADVEPKLNSSITKPTSRNIAIKFEHNSISSGNDVLSYPPKYIPYKQVDYFITGIPEITDRDVNAIEPSLSHILLFSIPNSLQQVGDVMATVHKIRKKHMVNKGHQILIVPSIAIIVDIYKTLRLIGAKNRPTVHIPIEKFIIDPRPLTEPQTPEVEIINNEEQVGTSTKQDQTEIQQNLQSSNGDTSTNTQWNTEQNQHGNQSNGATHCQQQANTTPQQYPQWTTAQQYTQWTNTQQYPQWSNTQQYPDWINAQYYPQWNSTQQYQPGYNAMEYQQHMTVSHQQQQYSQAQPFSFYTQLERRLENQTNPYEHINQEDHTPPKTFRHNYL